MKVIVAHATAQQDTYIAKAFRHNDLNGSGFVDFPRFKQALLPYSSGVHDQDLRLIFERYSSRQPQLNYKNFSIEFVSGFRRQAQLPEDEVVPDVETVNDTVARMKSFLAAQGPRALIRLSKMLGDADRSNSRTVPLTIWPHDYRKKAADGESSTQESLRRIDIVDLGF